VTTPGEVASPVVFFDLVGTVVVRDGRGRFVSREEVLELIPSDGRSGLLCNLPRGLGLHEATRILEEAGAVGLFAPDLMVVASTLPCALPDARAFAVAAALAGARVDGCRFVSADTASCAAAAEAGMDAVHMPVGEAARALEPGLFADIAEPMPQLFAGEVDEDVGPTFVLTGRVVTMAGRGEVLDDAQLVISRGLIAALVPAGEDVSEEYTSAPRIDTGGTIYPGLLDLHNHFVYDVLPLWKVPRCYSNRSQWPRAGDYASDVQLPVRALAERPSTARAIVRYVEAKALAGGTTTGQGMRTRVNGGPRLFHGAMRNVEETKDPRLPEAGTLVPTLYVNPERVRAFKTALAARTAYFYHLAEGRDDAARRTYSDLVDNDLLSRSLVGIHCLGLHPEDLVEFAGAGGKCVWSPFSNLLLYGRTLNLPALLKSGVRFSIGCDWTPTGSKNLLQELKVAQWVVESQSADLTTEDLARAVTCEAAAVVGWEGRVGTLAVGAFADLVVLRGTQGDPFDQLVDATESEVALVLVHGVARYGDWALLAQLHTEPDRPPERWSVGGVDKAFNVRTPDSDLSEVTFANARETLLDAMSDLVTFRESSADQEATLNAMGLDAPSFTLELDNEYVPSPDDYLDAEPPEPELAADWSQIAASVELDTVEVGGGDYWERIEAQLNIDQGLKERLRTAYER
jgi:5-methylthioadenosine/S-adenosylhomocysteine deaminase